MLCLVVVELSVHAFVLICSTRIRTEASGVSRLCQRRPRGRPFCLAMGRVVRVVGPYRPVFFRLYYMVVKFWVQWSGFCVLDRCFFFVVLCIFLICILLCSFFLMYYFGYFYFLVSLILIIWNSIAYPWFVVRNRIHKLYNWLFRIEVVWEGQDKYFWLLNLWYWMGNSNNRSLRRER